MTNPYGLVTHFSYTNLFFSLAIETIIKIEGYGEFQIHMDVAKNQREFYNQNCQNKELLRDHILIDMDFKQKIRIGNVLWPISFYSLILET